MQTKIKEPKHQSEFEVQSFIYSELRYLSINARGEVKVPFTNSSNRRATCRFDVAIFEGGFLVGIVEVKSSIRNHKNESGWLGTRQGNRYSSFGVPVRIIYGMEQAVAFIEETKSAGRIIWSRAEP